MTRTVNYSLPGLAGLAGSPMLTAGASFICYQALVCCLSPPSLIAPSGFNKTSHSFKHPLGSRGASHLLFLFPVLKVP